MKAVCYYGKEDVRVENVLDPAILNPRDAIVKVTATAICGSDLHIYSGYIPTMQRSDVLGCWSASSEATSIHRSSSSRIERRSTTRPPSTRRSGTSATGASRSS
jgi:hypothetical protein